MEDAGTAGRDMDPIRPGADLAIRDTCDADDALAVRGEVQTASPSAHLPGLWTPPGVEGCLPRPGKRGLCGCGHVQHRHRRGPRLDGRLHQAVSACTPPAEEDSEATEAGSIRLDLYMVKPASQTSARKGYNGSVKACSVDV